MLKDVQERTTPTDIVMWFIGGAILPCNPLGVRGHFVRGAVLRFTTGLTLSSSVLLGKFYALIAMGYTMVYGSLRMINFAHSEVFMSGPYTAYYVAAVLGPGFFGSPAYCQSDHHLPRLHGNLNLHRSSAGADCLSPLANGTPPGSSHHCHWSFLLSAIYLSRTLWFWFPGLSSGEDP